MIQGYNQLKQEAEHNDLHRKLFQFGFGVMEKKFTTVPTTDEVPLGYAALYESGSTRRIYLNFFGTMRYWNADG